MTRAESGHLHLTLWSSGVHHVGKHWVCPPATDWVLPPPATDWVLSPPATDWVLSPHREKARFDQICASRHPQSGVACGTALFLLNLQATPGIIPIVDTAFYHSKERAGSTVVCSMM